jgi:hypothetical protein
MKYCVVYGRSAKHSRGQKVGGDVRARLRAVERLRRLMRAQHVLMDEDVLTIVKVGGA